MLGLGLKRTDPADLYGPLKEFIISNHSKEEAKKLDDNIQAVNAARVRLIQALDRANANDYQSALAAAQNYAQTFWMISNRFPWGDHKRETFLGFKTGKVPTVKVKFNYYDAWRKNKKVEDSKDPNYEKAWVLYNIGSLYSLEALREKRNPDDGLKKAMQLFTQSAGVFQYLLDTNELLRPAVSSLNVDITADALAFNVQLLLAQAQAVFFEKAATTNSSPGLTAKLAAGASKLFKSAQGAAEKSPELTNWLKNSDYQWNRHCSYQSLIFQAAAHFWHAKSLLATDEYGLEIAHLNRATDLLKEAGKAESGLIPSLLESRKALTDKVTARLLAAVKDNNSIYYKPVPNPAVTPIGEIEQKVIVKPAPFKPPEAAEQNAFSSLVPQKIAEAASDFVARMSSFVAAVDKHKTDQQNDAKQQLMAKNLPAALEAIEPNLGLPEDVWGRVKDVQYKGGAKALLDVHSQLQTAVKDAWTLLANIRDILSKEAKTDGDMRSQFGNRWNRRPSAQITASYQRDVDACEKFLRDAQASDAKIADDWKANESRLADLVCTHDQLEARLPRLEAAGGGGGGPHEEHANTLRHLMDELSGVLDRRHEAAEALKKEANGVEIVPILLAAQKQATKTSDQIANDELAKLTAQFATVKAIDADQQALLVQITSANNEFVKSKSQNASAAARETVLQQINLAADTYNRLQNNLNEGLKFYTDLLRDFLEPLKQSVTDFMTARNMEAQIILQQLTEEHANYRPASAAAGAGAGAGDAKAPPSGDGGGAAAPAGAYAAPAYNPNVAAYGGGARGSLSGGSGHPALPSVAARAGSPGGPAGGIGGGGGGYEPLDMTPAAVVVVPAASAPPGGANPSSPQLSSQMPSLSAPVKPNLNKAAGGGGAVAGGGWACPTCTFVNNPNHLQCGMCATQQPTGAGGAPVAAAAPAPAAAPKKRSWF